MKKEEFYSILRKQLEITDGLLSEESDLSSSILLDSMSSLILVSIADENFGVTLDTEKLKNVTTVGSLMSQIGYEKFA
jgi:acyl carrier protein